MLWSYTRSQQSLTVETRFDNETQKYVATLIGASGIPETLRFRTAEAFRTWLAALERILSADHWNREGVPRVLPKG